MSRPCPSQVWISWCDECGQADYAFNKRPAKSDIGCPTCGTHPDCQLIAGPFVLRTALPSLIEKRLPGPPDPREEHGGSCMEIVMCKEHAYCPDSKPIVSHRTTRSKR